MTVQLTDVQKNVLDVLTGVKDGISEFQEVPTLLDIAKANAADDVVGLIDETAKAHPELTLVNARTIKGINYKTLVRTTLPTVGFRDANEGYPASVGVYENRLVETFIFNPRWECDKAVADRYEDGAEAYIALEASAIMEAAMQHLCEQFYYGLTTVCGTPRHASAGDAKGFPGLHDAVGLVAADNLLVDAGETGNEDVATSVWMVKSGPKDVTWVWGNGGALEVDDAREERVLDSAETPAPYTAYVQEMLAYPGLQIGNRYCVGRIGEIGAGAGTPDTPGTALTDTLLAQLYAKFPTSSKPDMILMNRRSQAQLRNTRVATSVTGTPVPFPTEWEGIPIHVTDAILNDEIVDLIS